MRGVELERDGLRMVVPAGEESEAPDGGGSGRVDGELIVFRSGQEEMAYVAIMDLEPESFYRWELRRAFSGDGVGVEANLLVGRSITRGAHRPDGPWRSRTDPAFHDAMALARPGAVRGVHPSSEQLRFSTSSSPRFTSPPPVLPRRVGSRR